MPLPNVRIEESARISPEAMVRIRSYLTGTFTQGQQLVGTERFVQIKRYVQTATGHNRFKREYDNREEHWLYEHWLYDTCIVTRWKHANHITLNSGGRRTPTTRRAMHDVFDCMYGLRVDVSSSAHGWIVRYEDCDVSATTEFVDGMTIAVGPVFR